MLALFAAIGLVGVVGATGMNVIKGPVRSMHNVTQKTIAENNMIASIKLAVMATSNQPNNGDCDADSTVEPIAWSTTGTGPSPAGGGYLPSNIGASLQDPWGNTYGYCVWDHGSAIQTACPTPTQRLRGAGVGGSGPVIAIISSGPDRIFQTSCGNAPTYVSKVAGSDDIVLSYTYAEAQSAAGGLWNLKSSDLDTAEINKSLEVKNASGDKTFELDRETGVGEFLGIRTGFIAAKGVEPVSMAGGLKVDNETNVTQCNLPQHKGVLRYHMSDGLQVCDGTAWVSAGGGAVPAGTIAAFASNTCPGGWSEYSPARGRFLRGRDPSGTNDVVRAAGNVQADSNRSHSHTGTASNGGAHGHTGSTDSQGNHTHTGSTSAAGGHSHSTAWAVLNAQGGSGYGYRVDGSGQNAGSWRLTGVPTDTSGNHAHGMNLDPAGAHTHNVTINSGGAHTHALTIDTDGGAESRPKNVAVTYCQYDGGAPVTAVAGLDNLSDVVLSAPQVGQVLIYDGANWINGAGNFSQWVTNGSNIYYNIGNVGIGINVPLVKLHAKSIGSEMTNAYGKVAIFEAGHPVIQFKGTSGNRSGFIGYDSQTATNNPEAMRFWVGKSGDDHGGTGASAMTIKANGNVGIAESMPESTLHILGNDSASPLTIDRPFHGPSIVMRNIAGPGSVNTYPNITDRWEIYPNGVTAAGTTSRLSFITRTPAGTPTTQASINNSGTLTVTGGVGFAGGRGGMNYYNVSPYDQVELGVSNSFPSTSLSFFTNSVSRMNINPAGLVGIGTVSPQDQLHVVGKILAASHGNWAAGSFSYPWGRSFLSQSGYIWSTTDAANTADANLYLHRHNTSNYFAIFGYGTSSVGTISTNGASVSYNTVSDYRLKDNVTPVVHGLDTVLALKPKQYIYKADKEAQKMDGFLAHEVQEILPYAVNGKKDEVDKDGKPKYQQLDYSKLTPVLTAAIQDLKKLFDGLAEKIMALTGITEKLTQENLALKKEVSQLSEENKQMRAEFDARLKFLEASKDATAQ